VPAIEDVLKTRSRDHWIELLGKRRVPCAPILTVAEAHAHPQVQAIGTVRVGAPELGEDNRAVFGEMTGRERDG
jgi:crotonobetainyl-CoA:carnitine CoA-transferase CaiB-like acyl-CoA transferase